MSKPDTKNVENDNLKTILMDLIGMLASKALLATEEVKDLMDRIVKLK